MRHLSKLLALTATALAFVGTPAAQADPGITTNLVDGIITLGPGPDVVCSWTDGSTSTSPPNTLIMDRNTINPPGGNLTCTGADIVTLNNSPMVSFGDGIAVADKVSTTGYKYNLPCTYEAYNVVLSLISGQHYFASYTAYRTAGYTVCPSTQPGTADITFH